MPKTSAERKALERKKKKAAGFTKWEIWIKPDWKTTINELIKRLKGGEND